MALDPEKLKERISELSKAYQRQIEKSGEPGYDPKLTDLLKKDLDWMHNQISETQDKTENRS
jgi:hypothetical protein